MLGIPGLSIDTLLSAPLLSYVLFPVLGTSWTTSINLLFFSILWATIVWSYSPLTVEFFSSLAIRVAFFLAPSASFFFFDTSMPSVAQSMKAHGPDALPVKAAGTHGDGSRTKSKSHSTPTRLTNIVALSVFNTLLGVALQSLIEAVLTEVLHLRSGLRMSATLPAPWSLLKDLTLAFLIRGTLGYYTHRFMLHSSRYSPTLTRLHRQYAHSLKTPFPFSAAYDHPACYLMQRWLPMYLPALFFRFHLVTYLLFTALVGMEEALVYSGYSVLPSTILLAGMARRQEKHVMSGGRGNYAPYGILDFVHGTTLGDADVIDDLRQEVGKRDVKGKANRVIESARGRMSPGRDDDQAEEGEEEYQDEQEDMESSTASQRSRGTKRRSKPRR